MHAANEPERAVRFSGAIVPLLFLAGIFFLNFTARIILAPLLVTVERELNLSHGQAGSLFLLISMGYCVTLYGSGFVSARYSHRNTVVFSILATGAALLGVAACRTHVAMGAGLLLLGMATGFYLPSGIATLTHLVSPSHWGRALAIHELAPNLGFVLAPIMAIAAVKYHSWRGILVILGVASLAMGGLYARFGRGGGFAGEAPRPEMLRILMKDPAFWIMTLLFSLAIGSSMGVYTIIPVYLVSERGMDQEWVNTLVAFSRIVALITGFTAGVAVDRLGKKLAMGGILLATGVMTMLLGLAPGSWVTLIVFLQPVVAVCFFPAGFAALSHISPPNLRGVIVALIVPVAILFGAGAIPAMLGFLGQHESFHIGFILLGGGVLCGASLLLRLQLPDQPARG
jgi:NNP family nitrate/nitrite transporter-like MFS transporter